MLKNITSCVLCYACALLVLASCSQNTHQRSHKKQYGTIYHATDGHYYTRSHEDGEFCYWLYMDSSSSSTTTNTNSFNTGGWVRSTTVPTGLTPTSKVVAEEEGVPTKEVEEESVAPDKETISESTTEAQAESAESTDSNGSSDSGSSSDSGGSDSGGGDSGGGDGGDGGGE